MDVAVDTVKEDERGINTVDTPTPTAPVELGKSPTETAESTPEPPAEPDELDRLLAEFDRSVPPQTEQQELQRQEQPTPFDEQKFNGAVQEHAQSLYEAEYYRGQLSQAFEQQTAKLQERLPDYLPPDYARSEMLAMSLADKRLEIAFESQFHDPVAIRVELERTNADLARAKMDPRIDKRVIPSLEQRAWQLGVACHGRAILRAAEEQIVRKASKPRLDSDVTADIAMVVQSLKGSAGRVEPERPPDLGRMSENEFRDYKRQFGF